MTLDADGVLDVPGEISVGSLVVADDISSGTGTVVVSGKLSADQISRSFNDAGLNPTAIDLVANYVVQVTISAARTLTTGVPPAGTEAVVIVVSSGATSITVTFGTGFKPSATLATGTTANRRFVLRFISDGTNLIETSRTAAIVY